MEKILNITRQPVTKSPAEQPNSLTRIEALLADLLTATKKAVKRGRNSGGFEWLDTAGAAARCNYSIETFRDFAKEYQIPRQGPKHNRYDPEELDRWMRTPSCFIKESNAAPAKGGPRKPRFISHLMSHNPGRRSRRRGSMSMDEIRDKVWAALLDSKEMRNQYERLKNEDEKGLL